MYDFLTWPPWVLLLTLKSDKHGLEWSRVAHQGTGCPALGQIYGNDSGRQAGLPRAQAALYSSCVEGLGHIFPPDGASWGQN